MAKLGYARVSTEDQNLDLQVRALQLHGCDDIVTDKGQSGSRFERPGLNRVLRIIKPGDTLVVWRLDRLGRSLKHLIETVDRLKERGVHFASLQEAIDTSSAGGNLIFQIMGALAEFERKLIIERTNAGLAASKARGVKGGRRKMITTEKLERARDLINASGLSVAAAAKAIGVGRSTLYRELIADREPAR